MADEVTKSSPKLAEDEEILELLKHERAVAQSVFTKRANILARTANLSAEGKLKAELEKLESGYCNLIGANTDYAEALSSADTEASRQQADNIGKRTEDCDKRFVEVEHEVKSSLWSRFAEPELAPLARRAEKAMDRAEEINVEHETFKLCEVQSIYLRESIEKTNEKLASWRAWIPAAHASELRERVVSLVDRKESLWLRWEKQFCDANRRAEEKRAAADQDYIRAEREALDEEHTDNVTVRETATGSDKQPETDGTLPSAASMPVDSVNTPSNPSSEPPTSTPSSAGSAQPGSASTPTSSPSAPPGAAGEPPNAFSGHHRAVGIPQGAMPKIHLARIRLPTFTGCMRSFYRWRWDWESLQRQGEPSGSPEIKKLHLLDSLDGKIKQNLGLSNSRSADEIFRLLENRYGNKGTIACQIIEEVDKISAVKGNQPRKTIDLIQAVERALFDLKDLGEEDALKNRLVIKSIESKLPDTLKRDWLLQVSDPVNGITPSNHFDCLLQFLKKQEDVLERMEQLSTSPEQNSKEEKRKAFTKATRGDASKSACIMCGDEEHGRRLFACKEFRGLDQPGKRALLKKAGACMKCLGSHVEDSKCTQRFICTKEGCQKGDHHYLLCPKKRETEGGSGRVERNRGKAKLTEEQVRFLADLPPDLLEKYKKAFTNKATAAVRPHTDEKRLMESGLKEHPVIMMLMMVTANAGQKIGTLIDLASDTNYITHKAARRLQLRGEDITLVIQGVAEMAMKVATKKYTLRVRVKTPKGKERAHELLCYGLDKIASVHQAVTPQQLKRFFPEVAT